MNFLSERTIIRSSFLQTIRILSVFHKSFSKPYLDAGLLIIFKSFSVSVGDIFGGLPLPSVTVSQAPYSLYSVLRKEIHVKTIIL